MTPRLWAYAMALHTPTNRPSRRRSSRERRPGSYPAALAWSTQNYALLSQPAGTRVMLERDPRELVRRIAPNVQVSAVTDAASLEATLKEVA